jgi:hypothetical protein
MGTIFANRAHAGPLELAGTRKKRLWSFFHVFFFSIFCKTFWAFFTPRRNAQKRDKRRLKKNTFGLGEKKIPPSFFRRQKFSAWTFFQKALWRFYSRNGQKHE